MAVYIIYNLISPLVIANLTHKAQDIHKLEFPNFQVFDQCEIVLNISKL